MNLKHIKIKKGFTLIELIVSIALIGVLFPSILSVFSATQGFIRNENSKLDTSTSAQSIIQTLKSVGYDNINALFKGLKSGTDTDITDKSFYIFYDSFDEINNTIGEITPGVITTLIANKKPAADDKTIAVAKSFHSGKKYAANILIKIDDTSALYYHVYKIQIVTFDLLNSNITSKRSAYFGE